MKITVTIHQLQLDYLLRDVLTQLGRQAAAEFSTKIKAYDAVRNDEFLPEYWQHYDQQGEIEVDTAAIAEIGENRVLENIFQAGNDDGYGHWAGLYNRYETAFSISVGDIIILGETAYIVAGCGFTQVELAREEAA